MADNQFLKYFITEPVYVIPDPQGQTMQEKKHAQKNSVPLEEESEVYTVENQALVYKGSNHRKVLIIVDEPHEEFISTAAEAFLSKILAAIQLKIEDTGIINTQSNPNLTEDMLLAFGAEKYLAFGINGIFGQARTLYEINRVSDAKVLLNCASLNDIERDPHQKKQLWTALQKMFL